jgi:hypothetical protein
MIANYMTKADLDNYHPLYKIPADLQAQAPGLLSRR